MRREDDYLLRLIREFATVIHYALGLAKTQKYDLAHDVLNETATDLLGLKLLSVVQLGADNITSTLQLKDRTTWQAKTAVLVWLLREDGEMYLAEEEEEMAYGRYLTALHLLLALSAASWETEDDIPTVDDLLERLSGFVLPSATYRQLISHFERQGAYADAEDILFTWLENQETAVLAGGSIQGPAPIETGIAFYQRLLQKEDEELANGNLPREEVESGLADLEEKT